MAKKCIICFFLIVSYLFFVTRSFLLLTMGETLLLRPLKWNFFWSPWCSSSFQSSPATPSCTAISTTTTTPCSGLWSSPARPTGRESPFMQCQWWVSTFASWQNLFIWRSSLWFVYLEEDFSTLMVLSCLSALSSQQNFSSCPRSKSFPPWNLEMSFSSCCLTNKSLEPI